VHRPRENESPSFQGEGSVVASKKESPFKLCSGPGVKKANEKNAPSFWGRRSPPPKEKGSDCQLTGRIPRKTPSPRGNTCKYFLLKEKSERSYDIEEKM